MIGNVELADVSHVMELFLDINFVLLTYLSSFELSRCRAYLKWIVSSHRNHLSGSAVAEM